MDNLKKKLGARGQGGFTLIELLVVIAILSILAGVVVFAVGKSTQNARVAACRTERGALIEAIAAADMANESSAVLDPNATAEDYTKYLENADKLTYFGTPTATGAVARKASPQSDKVTAVQCEPIP